MAQCTAKSKRTGERCRALAVTGYNVCRSHGARGGRPIIHGRWSKHAPERLAADIAAALEDSELISMREQFATLDALAQQRLREMGAEDPARQWQLALLTLGQLPDALVRLRGAIGPLATDEIAAAFDAIEEWHKKVMDAFRQGQSAEAAEADLRSLIQEQANVARQEVRRETMLIKGITVKQIGVLVAMILDSLRRNVDDADARRRIQSDLVRALGSGDRAGSGS